MKASETLCEVGMEQRRRAAEMESKRLICEWNEWNQRKGKKEMKSTREASWLKWISSAAFLWWNEWNAAHSTLQQLNNSLFCGCGWESQQKSWVCCWFVWEWVGLLFVSFFGGYGLLRQPMLRKEGSEQQNNKPFSLSSHASLHNQ